MSATPARLGLVARVGGVLVAPRATLAQLACGDARAGDIALFMCAWLVAGWLPLIVRAGVLGVEAGLDAGLFALMGTFQQLLPDVLGVLLAGIMMSLFVPKSGRGHGRSADLAAYAWIPYLAVQVTGSLVYSVVGHTPSVLARQIVTGVALAWAVAVWALAVDAARQPPSSPSGPSSATASATSASAATGATS